MPTPTLQPLPPQDLSRDNLYGYTADQMRAYAAEAIAAQAAEIERLTAALAQERERCVRIVMDAPLKEPQLDDDPPEVDTALKSMAVSILARIRGLKPIAQKPCAQASLDLQPPPTEPQPLLDAVAVRSACPRGYNRCGWDAVASQCVAEGCAPWQPQPITTKEPE